MTTIILLPNGSWDHEENLGSLENVKHARITIGPGWTDRQISEMISEYYENNLDTLFE